MNDNSEKHSSAAQDDRVEDGTSRSRIPGIQAAATNAEDQSPQLPLWVESPEGQGEARLRQALEVEAIGVIYFDMSGRILDANNAFLATSLYSREELEAGKLSWQRLTPREWLSDSREAFAELQARGETTPYEKQYIRKDGTRWWALFAAKRLNPNLAFEFVINISERKETEQALVQSERRLRSLIEAVPQLVWRSASHGDWTWASSQWIEYTGMTSADSEGLGWISALHPDDREAAREGWRQASPDGAISFDCRIWNALDQCYEWFQTRATPVEGDGQHLVEWVGTFTNINEQVIAREELRRTQSELEQRVAERTAELQQAIDALHGEARDRQKAEEQLLQSEKLKAIGQLTGGIAHDFNNLLAGISGSLEVIQLRVSSGRTEGLERYTGMALSSVKRAAALTHRLLAFSRQQSLAPRIVQPAKIISELEELIRRTVGPSISLVCRLAEDEPVLCDPGQLENAVVNLAINARDAMPTGGELIIEVRRHAITGDLAIQRELPSGDYVGISVTDNGEGMTPEVLARAFDPFFTTKKISEGTGLGLSMVYGFAQQSGGQARIHSTPGLGTTVTLYFPRQEGEESAVIANPDPCQMQRAKGETVLVVDDEAAVRHLMVEVLQDLGYQVAEAADGPKALELAEKLGHIDILVTDVGLSGSINGRDLAERLRSKRVGLKVLFVTGFAADQSLEQATSKPDTRLLTKPFSVDALSKWVRFLLDQNTSGS
ncbi:MAG: PAS domain S-box protein [Pseudomonas sp.]|nr:PAS domain S-box protein [Pseudomonas sp.]